jgi:hypothetical protein
MWRDGVNRSHIGCVAVARLFGAGMGVKTTVDCRRSAWTLFLSTFQFGELRPLSGISLTSTEAIGQYGQHTSDQE